MDENNEWYDQKDEKVSYALKLTTFTKFSSNTGWKKQKLCLIHRSFRKNAKTIWLA